MSNKRRPERKPRPKRLEPEEKTPRDALARKSADELRAMRRRIDQLLGDAREEADGTAAGDLQPNQGNSVRVFGADPKNRYAMRYEIREMDDLITSNTDAGGINPAYPEELQPRDRTRAASQAQIANMAQNLQPEALTAEFNALDRGAPIVGDDGVVESGNGRTMALRRAAEMHPDQYAAYKEEVARIARERGIDPAVVEKYKNPVLVRVRTDKVDRAAFAKEANTQTILGMSDTERAKSDAGKLTTGDLLRFNASDNIDTDINRASNRDFVRSFMAKVPEGERAALMDRNGELTQTGRQRIKAAMFTRVYNDTRLADRIFESTDNDTRNITNGLMGSLGAVARADEMARSGQRQKDLAISGDVAAAVNKLAAIKSDGKQTVEMYLSQQSMFGDDLTPTQKRIMVALHERRRSAKQVGELLNSWAGLVERQPPPNQGGLFGDMGQPTKDELIDRWLSQPEYQPQRSLFG